MKRLTFAFAGIFFLFLSVSCRENTATATPIPTNTDLPIPTITLTSTLTPTKTPVPTPAPNLVTLLSPFATTCGDGIPQIWSNDAYNATWYTACNDSHHGHVDWWVPNGCNVDNHSGDVVAPIDGVASSYDDGLTITLNKNTYPAGLLDVFKWIGRDEIQLDDIKKINIDIGHITLDTSGKVQQNTPIAEVIPYQNSPSAPKHFKIAYKVHVWLFNGEILALSPSLFPTKLSDGTILQPMIDGTSTNWICHPKSDYDCIPTVKDYSPTCKVP